MKNSLVEYLEKRKKRISESIEIQSQQIPFQDVLMKRHSSHQQWNFHNKARDRKKYLTEKVEEYECELSLVENLIRYSEDLP